MTILIDTNILLRSVQPSHPMHGRAVHARGVLMKREEGLVVALHNVAEFSPARSPEELSSRSKVFQVLTENAASYVTWKTLLIENRVSGVQVHDPRLVSVMKTYGIA